MHFSELKSFVGQVESCRRSARERIRAELVSVLEERESEGKYIHEGAWRSREEIGALNDALRRRDRGAFFEWILALALFAGLDILLAMILFHL